MKKLTSRKLFVPAVFLAGAGCSSTPTPKCGDDPSDACRPDGGYYCPAECFTLRTGDGGVELDAQGNPTCLC